MARLKKGKIYLVYLAGRRRLNVLFSSDFWVAKALYVPLIGPIIHSASARRLTEIDKKRVAFYGQFMGFGDLVFDVGANVGNRTKIFLALGAKVVAFEPQNRCARLLKSTFGGNDRFELVECALGSNASRGTLYLSNASPISSMSKEWIGKTSRSRFASYRWDKEQEVEITTLNSCIAVRDTPVFIKIDVEGFERDVLAGLATPVKYLSFEYTPECIDVAFECVDLIDNLGESRYQFSAGESMTFALDKWVGSAELKNYLSAHGAIDFGDIYAWHVAASRGPLD